MLKHVKTNETNFSCLSFDQVPYISYLSLGKGQALKVNIHGFL